VAKGNKIRGAGKRAKNGNFASKGGKKKSGSKKKKKK
jgi:hypothetical protein